VPPRDETGSLQLVAGTVDDARFAVLAWWVSSGQANQSMSGSTVFGSYRDWTIGGKLRNTVGSSFDS
jgi:hypothetical protein